MNKLRSALLFCALLCLAGAFSVSAQNKKDSAETKDKYQAIEVVKFDARQGVQFPGASMDVMMAEISAELKKLDRFKEVRSDNSGSIEDAIRLTGTVTTYKPGSRAARYLVGFGAGRTKLVAAVKFLDSKTGKVLLEKNVDGKVYMGVFGGDSSGVTRALAQEVADIAKKTFFTATK